MIRHALAATGLAALAACAPETAPTATTPDAATNIAGPVLSYTDAFVMAPLAGRNMTMGGINLSVAGGDVRLTGASSPAFGAIELHTMEMTDGRMQMRQADGFDIADGDTLALKRGGAHMMIFDPQIAIAPGDTVDLTLTFDANGVPLTLVVEAEVRAVGE